jgi:hypothetical protein
VDLLTALLGLALLIAVMVGLARVCLGGEGDLMSGLFRAPGLGWPRGVQEEDPPPGWGWSQRHEEPSRPGDADEPRAPLPERLIVRPGPTRRAVRG